MADRFIAGLLTALALCVTVVVVAFFLSVYKGGPGIPQTLDLWSSVPKLLTFVAVAGFIGGLAMGSERATNVLAHLWATAAPRRPLFTALLWASLVALWIALLAYGQP